jgi:alkylhydroperoxidase family enzyme
MLKYLIGRKLATTERQLGASMDYVRHILRTSFSDFLAFVRILKISEHTAVLPPDVRAIVGLVGSRSEDCGSCVQIAINHGLAVGVPREVLRAALEDRPGDLPPDVALGYRFACAVIAHAPDTDELRAALRERFGERGPIEVALVVASARFYPVVKRTLGYSTSCKLGELKLEGTATA